MEKRKADMGAKEFRKRSSGKPFPQSLKKFRDDLGRSRDTSGFSRRDRDRPPVSTRVTSVASVGNDRRDRTEVGIMVNGTRGVVDSMTAPVTSADQLTTLLKTARDCLNRM